MVGMLRGESPLPTLAVYRSRAEATSEACRIMRSRAAAPMKRIYASPLIWQIVSSRRIPFTGATISSRLRFGPFAMEALQSSPEEIGGDAEIYRECIAPCSFY